jgi:hypothetical protein
MGRFGKQDLLYLLKLEMSIIQGGGYGRPVMVSWRNITLMRDCVTCLNVVGLEPEHRCGECFLIEHVPESHRLENIPCHFIPLNKNGETIETLDRQGRHKEAQKALLDWIRATIRRLEDEPE